MPRRIHLLLIDCQHDFVDVPEQYLPRGPSGAIVRRPALPIAGAHDDMQRIAGLIRRAGNGLTAVTATMDAHHLADIAHPTFWTDAQGAPVPPFTVISAEAMRAGRFRPRDAHRVARAQAYLDALEASGRYQLTIWPVHCQIGSWGQRLHGDVQAALDDWQRRTWTRAQLVTKGTNALTEHYSAIRAEVPDPGDLGSLQNDALVSQLALADRVFIAGEAASHCVRATTEDLVALLAPHQRGALVLLMDCMSPVAGHEAESTRFFARMRQLGVGTLRAADVLPELRDNVH